MWISLFLSRLMVQLFSCAFKLAFAVWARLALLACCKPYWVCSEFNNASYSAVKYLNVPQPCETSGNCSDYCSLKNVLFDFMKYYPVFVEISIEPKIQEDPADFCCSSSEYFSPLWFSDLTNPHCISLSKMLLSLLLPKKHPSLWLDSFSCAVVQKFYSRQKAGRMIQTSIFTLILSGSESCPFCCLLSEEGLFCLFPLVFWLHIVRKHILYEEFLHGWKQKLTYTYLYISKKKSPYFLVCHFDSFPNIPNS